MIEGKKIAHPNYRTLMIGLGKAVCIQKKCTIWNVEMQFDEKYVNMFSYIDYGFVFYFSC